MRFHISDLANLLAYETGKLEDDNKSMARTPQMLVELKEELRSLLIKYSDLYVASLVFQARVRGDLPAIEGIRLIKELKIPE